MPARQPSHELFLVRHGVAEERGDPWPDDRARPLTRKGVAGLERIGRGLVRMGVSFDVILSSPLVRTRQTAETLAAAYDPPPKVVTVEALSPGGAPQAVLAALTKQARHTRIGVVGHEPDIGALAAFKKGAVCRIDVGALPPTASGTLRWFLPPKLLRGLGLDPE
jgi:phosphohistidine phosphatase